MSPDNDAGSPNSFRLPGMPLEDALDENNDNDKFEPPLAPKSVAKTGIKISGRELKEGE